VLTKVCSTTNKLADIDIITNTCNSLRPPQSQSTKALRKLIKMLIQI